MEIFALLFVILICIIFIFIGAYIIYDSTKYTKTTAIVINIIDLTNIDKNYIIDIQYYINSIKYVYKNINYKSDDEVKINGHYCDKMVFLFLDLATLFLTPR